MTAAPVGWAGQSSSHWLTSSLSSLWVLVGGVWDTYSPSCSTVLGFGLNPQMGWAPLVLILSCAISVFVPMCENPDLHFDVQPKGPSGDSDDEASHPVLHPARLLLLGLQGPTSLCYPKPLVSPTPWGGAHEGQPRVGTE